MLVPQVWADATRPPEGLESRGRWERLALSFLSLLVMVSDL